MDVEAVQERLQKIVRTIWLKLRHPSVKTNRYHCVRGDTEIILRRNGKLILGKNVYTNRGVTLIVNGGMMRIGRDVSFNRGDIIACHKEITIGDGCEFGPGVAIYDHDHCFSAEGFSVDTFKTSPVVIGDRCWIGANVTILRGTRIGEGSVIGAGAVVKGEIPPHSLVKSDRKLTIEPIRGGK